MATIDNDHGEVNPSSWQQRCRRTLKLQDGGTVNIISRSVSITSDGWNLTVWEMDQPATLMQNYWDQVEDFSSKQLKGGKVIRQFKKTPPAIASSTNAFTAIPLDPFGLVAWPGSVVAARELQKYQATDVQNKTVLILGAGSGVEVLAAASLGARQVIATDIHPTTLDMIRFSALQAGLDQVVTTRHFDICSSESLIDCDLMVVADLMYNPTLAQHIGRRCWEAMQRKKVTVLVSDSQRLADFLPALRSQLLCSPNATAEFDKKLVWQERMLNNFSGSGVMIDEDQVYDVKARILWLGAGATTCLINE